MTAEKPMEMAWGQYSLEFGEKTRIMGVVNVTPDSFSDGGLFFSADDAIAQGEKLAQEGADILDIGGESTRPGSESVSVEEEIQRVIPVIEGLAERIAIPISIDTTKSAVAQRALDAGAGIINDISALRVDPALADVAAANDVPLILMHMKGTPKTMQVQPQYDDLIGEIRDFLEKAIAQAESRGVARSKIIADPGIGFGKTFDHNLLIIRHLREFHALQVPLLVGPSRKAFIRNILKGTDKEALDPLSAEVESGTQATVAAAAINGAHIVRVHNVANARSTLQIIDALKNVRDDRQAGS